MPIVIFLIKNMSIGVEISYFSFQQMKNVFPKTFKYMNSKEGSNVCQNIEKNSGISSVDKVEEYWIN